MIYRAYLQGICLKKDAIPESRRLAEGSDGEAQEGSEERGHFGLCTLPSEQRVLQLASDAAF